MKRFLLTAAIAVATLSSCSKSEVITSNLDNQAIGFGVYTGTTTKGTETTSTSIKDAVGFGVYGYYQATPNGTTVDNFASGDTPNFMFNEQITHNGTNWTYSPVKYWSNNLYDQYSFFAYAPYNSTSALITTSPTYPALTYTIGATPDAMTDLVVDMIYNVSYKGSTGTPTTGSLTTTDTTVDFEMKHILTRANFTACLADDIIGTDALLADVSGTDNATTTRVFITDMKLLGQDNAALYDQSGAVKKSLRLYSTATYIAKTDGTDAGDWNFTNATKQSANYDLFKTGFANLNDAIINVYDKNFDKRKAYNVNKVVEVDSQVSTQPNSLFATGEYLFLIPPVNNGEAKDTYTNSVYAYLQYDVVTPDANLDLGYSLTTNYAIVELTGLKEATAYNYLFEIGLSSVKVSATVADWNIVEKNADVETDTTTSTSTATTATTVDELSTAIETLNNCAADATGTTFYVDATTATIATAETVTIALDSCNFAANDSIVVTFKNAGNASKVTFTITDNTSPGLTFTQTTSGAITTIAVTAVP